MGSVVTGFAIGATSVSSTASHRSSLVQTMRTMHYAYPTYHRAIETVLKDLAAPR